MTAILKITAGKFTVRLEIPLSIIQHHATFQWNRSNSFWINNFLVKKKMGKRYLGVKQCVWIHIAVKHFVMLELVVTNLERSSFHTALGDKENIWPWGDDTKTHYNNLFMFSWPILLVSQCPAINQCSDFTILYLIPLREA